MIADLRHLWQEAFGDSEEALDAFFAVGYDPHRCHYIPEKGIPVSALYWFDCQLQGRKFAYLYAVATLKSHRGKGLARRLLAETHEILKEKGYAGAILVPGEKELFAFYEQIGYRTVTSVTEFTCSSADTPVDLRETDATEYARLRKDFLPADSVLQEGAALAWLHTYAKFYAGENFLFSAATQGDTLLVQEFLGDPALAPRIVTALGMTEGRFRTSGAGRDFAMVLPFTADCPIPGYFGLALD